MANMSDYLEVQLIDHTLRTSTFSKPSGVWVCLLTTTPTDSNTGSTIVEPSTGGYARFSLGAPADADWNRVSASTGIATNAAAWSWTASGGNYGTITSIALVDASTAGNVLFWGALAANKTINDGDTFTVSIAGCSLTLA